jgi:hypothetical protein
MLVALTFERSHIPFGIPRRKDIGWPIAWASTPARRRWTVAARPWGPPPITTTSWCDPFVLTSDASLHQQVWKQRQLGQRGPWVVATEHGLNVEQTQGSQV